MKVKFKFFLLISILILATTLRFYKLASNPPSLYWDEASLGYNAYSILKAARDEHRKFLPLTNFAAFGDYKPPIYIYLTVPSIAAFGLSEFAIRLPSALFGVLTVLLTYLIALKLFEKRKVALIASFFLAISPWHLQFSRAAFEANVGLFFSSLGIYLFLAFVKLSNDQSSAHIRPKIAKVVFLLFSAFSFLAGMYTFTGQRLFVPFMIAVLTVFFYKELIGSIKIIIPISILSLVILLPLFNFATKTQEGKLRFNEVTIFNDLEPINQSNLARSQDNFSLLSAVVHNRRLNFANEYLKHYFDAFNPSFLFTKGDVNPRLSTQDVGELYLFDIVLIPLGLYFIIKNKTKNGYFLIAWLLISPLGPATARETPHALRMVHILPTFQILAAIGLFYLQKITKSTFVQVLACLVVFLLLFYYLHIYYIHWRTNYSASWQYGYKEAVEKSKKYYDQVDKIIVTKDLGRPYIYFLLYYPFSPQDYWKKSDVRIDRFYFIDVASFDKFAFGDDPDAQSDANKVLFILPPNRNPKNTKKLETIYNLENKPVFDISIKE